MSVFLIQGVQRGVTESEARLHSFSDEVQAREVALTGMSDAVARVSQAVSETGVYSGPWEVEGQYSGGRYQVEIVREDSLLVFTSKGSIGRATKHVRQSYRPRAYNVPEFARRAILVDMMIQLDSRLVVNSEAPTNADVHSNMHLQFGGNTDISVTGFGRSSMQVQSASLTTLLGLFAPHRNPDLLPTVLGGAPRVQLPSDDLALYRSMASRVWPGSANISGAYQMGTQSNPVVWFVNGDLSTWDDVQFDGWGIIVVTGQGRFNHHVRTVGDHNQSRLLWIIGSHVFTSGTGLDITGSMHVRGKFNLGGPVRILNGSLIAGHLLQIDHPLEIYYREFPLPFADILWPDHIVSRSYREW